MPARKFTFDGIMFVHEIEHDGHKRPDGTAAAHRITTQGQTGPWAPLDRPCTYKWKGRLFCALGVACELPEMFELIAPEELIVTLG